MFGSPHEKALLIQKCAHARQATCMEAAMWGQSNADMIAWAPVCNTCEYAVTRQCLGQYGVIERLLAVQLYCM